MDLAIENSEPSKMAVIIPYHCHRRQSLFCLYFAPALLHHNALFVTDVVHFDVDITSNRVYE
jgi:hypothetical protein